MPRVKGGTVSRQRRKKVLKLAKGYFGSKHRLYKVANQQVMKSGNYAFRDRRQKKRDFRKLWITRINLYDSYERSFLQPFNAWLKAFWYRSKPQNAC